MDIKDLEHIFSLLKRNDIVELDLEQDGTKVSLKRGVAFDAGAVAARPVVSELQPAIVHSGAPSAAPAVAAGPSIDHLTKVESPIVGTFYRKPNPEADAFVREGEVVKKGQTLCIIEAMKLMNEIEAPCAGKVEKCLLSDGEVVEFGEVLFLINPNA